MAIDSSDILSESCLHMWVCIQYSAPVCASRCVGAQICVFLPPTYVGTGGESSRGEANFASSCHWSCCCCPPSWQTWSGPCSCSRPPPPCSPRSDPGGPTSCSHHGTYPVDRLGFGAAPCTCRSSPSHLRPLLRLPGVLGGVRGERCKRGKGGRRGG